VVVVNSVLDFATKAGAPPALLVTSAARVTVKCMGEVAFDIGAMARFAVSLGALPPLVSSLQAVSNKTIERIVVVFCMSACLAQFNWFIDSARMWINRGEHDGIRCTVHRQLLPEIIVRKLSRYGAHYVRPSQRCDGA
jgi:hypothetical protein